MSDGLSAADVMAMTNGDGMNAIWNNPEQILLILKFFQNYSRFNR